MTPPDLFLHPSTDPRFRAQVHRSLGPSGGRPVDDPEAIAAVEALLRDSYPLASVEARDGTEAVSWDIFRDGAALDRELVRRVRSGDAPAAGRIYDRHGRTAYAVALRATGRPSAAADAIIESFHAVIQDTSGALDLRVALATRARRASQRTISSEDLPAWGPDVLTREQREVIELAVVHGLLGTEIARVLERDISDVRKLANAGLLAVARSGRAGGTLP